jgi:hypothetical protein
MRTNRRLPRGLLARALLAALAALTLPLTAASCGDDTGDGDGDDGDVGSTCVKPSDCYPTIDPMEIQGDVVCIDKVEGGYCSHRCVADADCCAAQGECGDGHPEVCSPFESTGELYCFLSCEDAEVGDLDPTAYCDTFAHKGFQCRSSGGGSQNRMVCVPG